MALPRSVQQQADSANKHFESLQNPAPAAPEADEKAPDAPVTDKQPAEPEQKPETERHSQGEDKTPTDEPQRSEAYWEHRFNVINGKYAKEVPALQEKVRTLTQDLESANRQITELKSASDKPTNPGGLTDADMQKAKDEFGPDVVEFFERLASSGRGPDNSAEVAELKREIRELKQQDRQKTEASFLTALNELVPDWETVNVDPKFHAFLAQYDSQTGKQRQQTLTEKHQALDADGVAAVFDAFKKQQPKEPQSRIPDDQVDPPTSRSTTAPEGKRIWTGAEITAFYKDRAAGRYRNDPNEAKRLEADIFAAQREGRVKN